jgi:hypothetical protein
MRFGLARFVIVLTGAAVPNRADRNRFRDIRARAVQSLLGKMDRVRRRILRERERRPGEHLMRRGARRRGDDPSDPPASSPPAEIDLAEIDSLNAITFS